MASPTASYWICPQCLSRNMKHLSFCVGCDARSPLKSGGIVSPPSSIPYHGVSQPIRTYSPQPRFQEETPSKQYSFTSRLSPPNAAPSPPKLPPAPIVRVVQDVEFENHQRQEILGLRRQLDDAVAAHTKLMVEYVALSQKNANAEADIELLSAEVASLRSELNTQQDGIHSAADEKLMEKVLEIQSLRQQVEDLVKEKSRLTDRLESSVTALTVAQSSREALQVASTEPDVRLIEANETIKTLKARHAENLATIAKLTREIDDLRLKEEKASTENANRLHKVMQEALAANESVIQKVTQDLMSSKVDLSRQFEHERDSLGNQIQRLSDDLRDVRSEKDQTERKLTEYIDQLEATNEKLRQQKDELQSEAKFQLEIISELKSEKSALAAEASFLRDTMTSVTLHPYRDNGMNLIRPSLVNVSHNRDAQYAAREEEAQAEALEGPAVSGQSQFAANRETLGEQQLKAQVKALTEAMDESATKLQSVTFEAAELRKQLARMQDSLKDRDSDLTDAQATIETLEKKLENQKQYTAAAQKDLETLEAKLQEQTSELKARLESSNQQNKDILEQNAAMREKSDATDIAMREMEQALSDALEELEEIRQQKDESRPPPNQSHSLSNSAGPDQLLVSLSSTQVQLPLPSEVPPPASAAPALELSEARELVESFAKEPKAMRALSFAQRRMRSKSETQGAQ